MTGTGLLQFASAGLPGLVLALYGLSRLADRLVFLAGLRMILRETRREDRVAAIVAYTEGTRRGRRRAVAERASTAPEE